MVGDPNSAGLRRLWTDCYLIEQFLGRNQGLLHSSGLLSDARLPFAKEGRWSRNADNTSRLVPTSPMFVSLDDSKSGLLLDVGEGGVAVASLIPRNLDDVISLAFELPEGSGHVQAVTEVAWIRDSGHLTGVRFLNVDELSQRQLCRLDWRDTAPVMRGPVDC